MESSLFKAKRYRFQVAFLLLLLSACLPAHAQAPTSEDGPLQTNTDTPRVHLIGNDDIVKMAKAGLGDDLILQTIQIKPGHYDTSPDDLIALKTAGVSNNVIAAMEAHGTGLATRKANAKPDPAPLSNGVDEIGVYYKSQKGETAGQWLPLQTERVVFKSAGELKAILSQGIINKDMNGRVEGGKSPLVLPNGFELLIYAPLGTDGNEYDLLRLRDHKNYREFRTLTGGILHSQSGPGPDEVEFHPKKIAPQMYSFTVPNDIEKGEYGILPPGSANQQGIAGTGKIFTFSIIE
jgi:hypothetical protein